MHLRTGVRFPPPPLSAPEISPPYPSSPLARAHPRAPLLVPTAGCAGRRWRLKEGGDPPAVGAGERRHPPAVVPEDHLLRCAADLRHPARIFARRQRVRDERVADVVLPARVKAAAPKR